MNDAPVVVVSPEQRAATKEAIRAAIKRGAWRTPSDSEGGE